MKINVLFFGVLTDITGKDTLLFEDIADTDQLNAKISDEYPGIKSVSYRLAVNQEIIDVNTILDNGDEVAFMPPFAGG